uniref:VASP tetramerisation domain-containing protein n=1 Tax=Hucho hucho TaxID=62062 RepID=A0A4W5S1T1_9TELE
MGEMSAILARRKKMSDNPGAKKDVPSNEDSSKSPGQGDSLRRPWEKSATIQRTNSTTKTQLQESSPTSPALPPAPPSPSSAPLPRMKAVNITTASAGSEDTEMERIKQDILEEVRNELHKVKDEIIEAFIQELQRRGPV